MDTHTSRRAVLSAIPALAPAIAIAGSNNPRDPIYAAIDDCRAASAFFRQCLAEKDAIDRDINQRVELLSAERIAALDKVFEEYPHALPARQCEVDRLTHEIRTKLHDSPEGRRADAVEQEGSDRENAAILAMLETVPTTAAGCIALIDYVLNAPGGSEALLLCEGEDGEPGTDILLATLGKALRVLG